MQDSFSKKAIAAIKKIPPGKVATYGQIAAMAGNPQAARQVVWILNSSWRKEKLPWHRIINSRGSISLKPGSGFEIQKTLLSKEGVIIDKRGFIDLDRYQWRPTPK